MKLFFIIVFTLSLFTSGCNSAKKAATTSALAPVFSIACIGDGTTLGYGLNNKDWDSYPSQLQRLLGSKWQVNNFGVHGATILHQGEKPYRNQEAYTKALASNPNVVIIALGASDIDSKSWEHRKHLIANLRELVEDFGALENTPDIFLCYPPPSYAIDWENGGPNTRLSKEIIPQINKVASESQIPIIDLFNTLKNKPELFPDTRHPNAQGSRLIAAKVYSSIIQVYSMPAAGDNQEVKKKLSPTFFQPNIR